MYNVLDRKSTHSEQHMNDSDKDKYVQEMDKIANALQMYAFAALCIAFWKALTSCVVHDCTVIHPQMRLSSANTVPNFLILVIGAGYESKGMKSIDKTDGEPQNWKKRKERQKVKVENLRTTKVWF